MGYFLHIGKGEFLLCAISSLLAYLTLRGNVSGPLFLFWDGQPLSCALLTSWLRGILSAAGIQGNFSGHSFQIGAATVAARNGIPDHQIQALGRWTSSAYLLYIRTPAESLSRLSKQLSLSAAHWWFTSGPSGSVWCARFCIANFWRESVPHVAFKDLAKRQSALLWRVSFSDWRPFLAWYVSILFFCFALWNSVLESLGGWALTPPCLQALHSSSTLEGRVWWLPLTGLSWIPFAFG